MDYEPETDFTSKATPTPKAPEPKKKNGVTLTDRKSAAKAVATSLCDVANTGAMLMTKGAMVNIDGDLKSANMTDEEYEKISSSLANVLAPYDWITKVKAGSDVGALVLASTGWLLRAYMIYKVTHPEGQGVKLPGILPFSRKAKAPAPVAQVAQAEPINGKPPDIDLSAVGFGAVGAVDGAISE